MKLPAHVRNRSCLLALALVAIAALSACSDAEAPPGDEPKVEANTSADIPEQENRPEKKAAITIENAFIKELPPGKTVAAAYMRIVNNTEVTQSLNYVHSPIAESVEIHRIIYNEGMMQMRPVGTLSLNPGESLVLEPGGFHLMVFGIYQALNAGDSFELNFEFESGENITTTVKVKS